jgi:hypothetical protein
MARDRWLSSLNKLDSLREKIDCCFAFVFEEPFTVEASVPYMDLGPVVIHKKRNDQRFNWWPDRNEVMTLKTADYYLMTDDDCRFGGPTPLGYTSSQRYYDGVLYMEENVDCGAVIMLPFLGGSPSGHKIMVADRELFALGSGLILRKLSGFDYSHSTFNRPGALDEPAAVFSRIERGYYAARTFNTPTSRPPTKKVQPGSAHPAYDDDFINTEGIGKQIRDRYQDPDWHHNARRIPKGCVTSYREQCRVLGFEPKY